MKEEQHNLFDVIFKVISGIFVAVVFFIGLKQFRIQTEIEKTKIFYEKQMEYVNELVGITSTLSTNLNLIERDSLTKKFRTLYNGKLQFYMSNTNFIKIVSDFRHISTLLGDDSVQVIDGKPKFQAAKDVSIEIGKQAKAIIDSLYEVKL